MVGVYSFSHFDWQSETLPWIEILMGFMSKYASDETKKHWIGKYPPLATQDEKFLRRINRRAPS